jgi:hypothetical protein
LFSVDNIDLKGLDDFEVDVASAGNDTVYFVYPATVGTKKVSGPSPRGYPHRTASISDWTASGVIVGMTSSEQLEGVDTGPWVISGGALDPVEIPNGSAVVLLGGPAVNSVVYYYEHANLNGGPTEDFAPLFFEVSTGSRFYNWNRSSDNAWVYSVDRWSTDFDSEDYFVLEVMEDSVGRSVYLTYGLSWKGTWAAAKFFKYAVYPDLSSYDLTYYVVKWTDAGSGSSANGIPDMGDTFEVVAEDDGGS